MERRSLVVARWVVGGLLLLESVGLLLLAAYVALFGGLLALLAVGVDAAGTPDDQLSQGAALIFVAVFAAFLLAGLVGIAGALLLIRRGPRVVMSAGGVAIAAQIAFHLYNELGVDIVTLLPFALHMATIGLAFGFAPRAESSEAEGG